MIPGPSRATGGTGLLSERHVVMWDFSILLSISLLLRTLPLLLLRIFLSVMLMAVFACSVVLGIGLFRRLVESQILPDRPILLALGGLLGLCVGLLIIRWARAWLLYLVKAAHIAVLVELVQGRRLPPGRSQIGYGHSVVRERFGEASALFLLDGLVKSVLAAINRLTFGFLAVLPARYAEWIHRGLRVFLYFAIGYLDEIVLAHAIDNRSDNPWTSARTALVLYGQNWKTILKNALWLTVFFLGLVALIGWLWLWPALAEYQAARDAKSLVAALGAVLVAASFFTVFTGPFALVCMLQIWFRTAHDDTPSPAWSATVSRIAPQLDDYRTARTGGRWASGTTRNGDLV